MATQTHNPRPPRHGRAPRTASLVSADLRCYRCRGKRPGGGACTYVYNPFVGDPQQGYDPTWPFPDLDPGWACPHSGTPKDGFEPV